ncbi:MAG: phage/plasmid primase, P4 family [Muribaculaceae bacterium]|nr:phage/plasmid primase, P4 family [Muribaculaceae bacterium]
MYKNDPFTFINDYDDDDQYEEMGEEDLSELAKEIGFLTFDELAEMADKLSAEEDFSDDETDCFYDCNKGFTPISEYWETTVIPYEKNRRMAETIKKSSVQEALVPKNVDLSKMKSYDIAKYLTKSCVNVIRIDNLTYFYRESNGTYYCLNNVENRGKFKNELPSEIHSQIGSIEKVIDELLTIPNIESREFSEGNDGSLINFKDGVLDIFSGEVYEHSPEYTFTYCLDAYIRDIDREDNEELFRQYLDNSFGNDTANISNLQEMLGVAISQIRDQKIAFFLHGKSNSGKSVMLDLLKKLIGEDFYSSVSFEQLASRFGTAHFSGKSLNISGEAPDITAKRLDTFKTVVGNDTVMAEHKGKDGFYMRNRALLVFAANSMPEVSIHDEAYYNRLRIIRYNKSVDKSQWIKNLPERLFIESIGTILRFAIEGLRRFINNGMELTYIETSDQYVDEYRNDANSFISFAIQFVVPSNGGILLSRDLFRAYEEYCSQNGLTSIGTNKCSKMLLEVFPEAEKTTTGHEGSRCYKGLKCTYPSEKF